MATSEAVGTFAAPHNAATTHTPVAMLRHTSWQRQRHATRVSARCLVPKPVLRCVPAATAPRHEQIRQRGWVGAVLRQLRWLHRDGTRPQLALVCRRREKAEGHGAELGVGPHPRGWCRRRAIGERQQQAQHGSPSSGRESHGFATVSMACGDSATGQGGQRWAWSKHGTHLTPVSRR